MPPRKKQQGATDERATWQPAPIADPPKQVEVGGVRVEVHARYRPLFSALAASPDGARLYLGFATDPHGGALADTYVRSLDVATRQEIEGAPLGAPVAVQTTAARPWIAASIGAGYVRVYDVAARELVHEVQPESAATNHLFAFTRDAGTLLHGGYHALVAFDTTTWAPRWRTELGEHNPSAVACTSAPIVAVGRELWICEPIDGRVQHRVVLPVHVTSVVADPAHSDRVVVLGEQQAFVVDSSRGALLGAIPGRVMAVALGRGDRAAVLRGRAIERWDLATLTSRPLLEGAHAIATLAVFAGDTLVTAGTHLRFFPT